MGQGNRVGSKAFFFLIIITALFAESLALARETGYGQQRDYSSGEKSESGLVAFSAGISSPIPLGFNYETLNTGLGYEFEAVVAMGFLPAQTHVQLPSITIPIRSGIRPESMSLWGSFLAGSK